MSDQAVFQRLMQSLSDEAPCGQNLEDTAQLAAFDVYKIFGQQTEIGTRPTNKPDDPAIPPVWDDVVEKSLASLAVSKDLRVLAYLGAGLLWRDGLRPFCEVLQVAAGWLDSWFDDVYPRVEDDIFFRANALNFFGDRLAIIEPLRRAAIVSNRPLGAVSLRALEIATGVVPAGKSDDVPPKEAELHAVFQAVPIAELQAVLEAIKGALAALGRIDARMTAAGGIEATPNFDGRGDAERAISLRHQLKRIQDILRDELKVHPEATAAEQEAEDGGEGPARPAGPIGPIRSRQDAIRALDAVTMYFRQSEPSSPVPIFIERAKRLVAKNFLEVLEDVVPDALKAAKAAGGIRDEQT
jgi:type VI secretion system protein ImpA